MRDDYKNKMASKIAARYQDLEERIMQDIVRRIVKTGEITSTADWQINRLRILGYSSEDIEREIKKTLNASYPEMFELYDKVIEKEYVRDNDVYEQINAEYIPYDQNEQLNQITEAIIDQSCEDLENITNSLGFYLDYGNGRKVLTPLAQVYSGYLDAACYDIVTGAFDYNSVLRRVVTQLTNSGLRKIDYASGRADRVDVAARRAVMTAVSQITGKISEYNAQKLGTGYALGDVTLDYETKKCDYDRGRMFTVDAMDNIESAGIAFGRLSGEFLRTQVVPELDTWRLAKYAGYASGNNVVTGAIADGKAGIAAIRAGKTAIKNAEAKTETCYLFISTTLKGMIDDLDTTASKKAMEDWAGVIEVPASRFFDKVTLTKTGAGGFATTGGKAIDFLIVDKNAAIQYQKHTVSKIITPEQNQTADAWKFGYRTVGIAEAKDNKKVAIYVHKAGE